MNWLNGGTLFVQAVEWFNPEDLPPSYPPPGFSSNNPNPHFESPRLNKKNDKNLAKKLKIFKKEKFWRRWKIVEKIKRFLKDRMFGYH